jgi:hypothetical protein
MVSTGSLSTRAASAANATTINMAGQRGRQKRKPAKSAMLTTERLSAAGESVEIFDHRKGIFSRSGPGSAPLNDKPSGLISPEKIVTAMPAVKPTVTG